MGYQIYKLQNCSSLSTAKPDIVIDDTHPDWEIILATWKSGKNPTDSPHWKKGVFACTRLVQNDT